jgi:nicotinamide phosphoribosyltransferase
MNNILLSDAYKYSHHRFYHPDTSLIYSYLESRGGAFENTVFYGLQYFLKAYLSKPFTRADIEEAREVLNGVFGRDDVFDASLFEYILEKHGGYFPVRIKAVPEGTLVPLKNVLMSIENTDPQCAWVTNFLETLLLQVWYPITVASLSRSVKGIVREYLKKNSDNDFDQFMLNDFGFRGVSSVESAGLGGSAHLINFLGSDTLVANTFIRQYYNTRKIYGQSIPATEHSICTQQGEAEEAAVFERVLKAFPSGMVACVSDSYDIFRACEHYWGEQLKAAILDRSGVLVIRPDSGDPARTLTEVFDILFRQFGATTNRKGYRVLPPQIRVIQGDGVHLDSIKQILQTLDDQKIAAENLVFGMGGKLLQGVNRDTLNFAFKCSYTVIDGKGYGVSKSPIEMDAHGAKHPSFKKSKKGILSLRQHRDTGEYRTCSNLETDINLAEWGEDLLVPVFENGRILKEWTFEEIRERAGF